MEFCQGVTLRWRQRKFLHESAGAAEECGAGHILPINAEETGNIQHNQFGRMM
jgi:hypothetical protein